MKSFCKIMLPAEAGTTFLKKSDTKSELEQKDYERGILKVAIYQGQSRTVYFQLARQWLVFFENHKISPTRILGRPGGMRGGAGERFERGQRSADLRSAIFGLVVSI